jgi:solute carrier family 13 (sodium-dependent dicarboxylate transporter), member 2/3/5
MLKAIDWNIIFLFGGGLVLGLGIESSGLASLMGNIISQSAGSNLTEWSIFAISAVMGFVMSYAASNTASAVIMCPIAASLAIGAGFNPIPPIIAAGLAASISSAIPSTTPPMAIIYSSRAVSILNMFKTGIVSDLLRIAILIMLGPLLINLIY